MALKVVRGGQYVDESMVRMVRREAETLARLQHPNIGAIHEAGRTEDGRHFSWSWCAARRSTATSRNAPR